MKKVFFLTSLLIIGFSNVYSQLIAPPSEAFGDQLIIGVVGTPPSVFDPFHINNLVDKQINRLIFGEGLIQQADRFGQPPALVDRYIYSSPGGKQGTVWKYVLKRNINFQDGIPLRNKDVLFTFNVLKRWGGNILNRQINFSNLKTIEVNGDLEIHFILKKRDNSFDKKLSDVPILSSRHYRDLFEKGHSILPSIEPLGYGPFQFEVLTPREVRLVSHPHYIFGRPFLNRVTFRYFRDEQKLMDSFIRSNVDMIEVQDRITAQRLHQILKNDIKIFTVPRPEKKLYFLQFNMNQFPFNSLKVRQAVLLAIDRSEIVRRLVEQNGHVAYSMIDYTSKSFFKGLFKENFKPTMSYQVLQADGWKINLNKGVMEKNGKELRFDLYYEKNSFLEESIARSIKIHLSEIGINVRPLPVTGSEKQRLLRRNQYAAIINNYSYYQDDLGNAVRIFYNRILRNRPPFTNYRNLTLEKLLKQGNIGSGVGNQLIQRFQIILHQEVPVVFLFFQDKIIYAVKNRFQNIRVSYSSGKVYYYRLNPLENWFVPKVLQKYRGF